MNAIEIRHVTKQFGSVVAVNDLTLDVPEGSIYGFIGPNGSGKTTTIRMIMNIILPDTGEIAVLGRPNAALARDEIGYLPEEGDSIRKCPSGGSSDTTGASKVGASPRSTPLSPDGWNGSSSRPGPTSGLTSCPRGWPRRSSSSGPSSGAASAHPGRALFRPRPGQRRTLRDAVLELRRQGRPLFSPPTTCRLPSSSATGSS